MRLLITVPWGERHGGGEAILHSLLTGPAHARHDIELIFFEAGPWPAELAARGFAVTVIRAGRLRHLHRWVTTVLRLASLFRRRKPDLILNWIAKTQLYSSPAAVLAGMTDRVVWWQLGIPRGGWLDRCATLLPAAAIGCLSHAGAAAQTQLFPRRPTFVVHPGAAVGDPSPATSLDVPQESIVVGVVGRLSPEKGQDRLVRACSMLRDRGHTLHLMVVGGDAPGQASAYARSLPALVDELGLCDVVTMTGHVVDPAPYIHRLDILVNPCCYEGFGVALLEAMAQGIPVVAVDAGAPPEFIESGNTGVLAVSGEPTDLAHALEPLLESPSLRHNIGGAGREAFQANFTEVAMCRRFFREMKRLGHHRSR